MYQKKIYALRNISFWYDDEYYYPLWNSSEHIGHITAIFEDKEQAIKEWKRLEYEFSHHIDFDNIFETREIIDFKEAGIDKCVKYINNLHCDELHKYLNSLDTDELFDILHQLDIHAYYLYEYPKNLKQSVSWDNTEKNYEITHATTEDDRTNNFIDASFLKNDPLLKEIIPPCNENRLAIVQLKGYLSELSDTPQLLERLIQNNPDIKYQDQNYITIKPDAFASINPLLKDKFKIRYLTIEEIYEIEKSFNQTYIKEV